MFGNRKNIATVAVALMVAFATSVNAQAQENKRVLLTDETAEAVDSVRKAINDLGIVSQKSFYDDERVLHDGNALVPVKGMTQNLAHQNFSLGLVGQFGNFAGFNEYGGGLVTLIGYRKWTLEGDFVFLYGHPDSQSADQGRFWGTDVRIGALYEVISWGKKHNRILLGADVSHKTRKDMQKMTWETENSATTFYNDLDAKTFGFHGNLMYQYCPRESRWCFFLEGSAGLQQNYKGNLDSSESSITSGNTTISQSSIKVSGKKWYPEFNVKIGVTFNLFNKKNYNKALLNNGMSKKQIKAVSARK